MPNRSFALALALALGLTSAAPLTLGNSSPGLAPSLPAKEATP